MLCFMKVKYALTLQTYIKAIYIFDSRYILPLEEVFIGFHAMQYFETEVALTTSDIHEFHERCSFWWVTAVKEAIKWITLRHSLRCNLHWLQPDYSSMICSVKFFCSCLPF